MRFWTSVRVLVAVAALLLASGLAWAEDEPAAVLFGGADAHVAAEVTIETRDLSGELVDWETAGAGTVVTMMVVVEAEPGVEVGEIDSAVALGPDLVPIGAAERVSEDRGDGGRVVRWTQGARIGGADGFRLGEIAVPYSFTDAAGSGTLVVAPTEGGGFVAGGDGLTASDEPSAARGAVGGRWLSVWVWAVVLAVVGLIVLGFALAGLLWLVKKGEERAALRASVGPPPRPAHEVALERLLALEREGLIERGQYAAVEERACDIARDYIGDRFGLRAPEMTTNEFLWSVSRGGSGSRVLEAESGALGSMLRRVDEVKFAKAEARRGEAVETVAAVRGFVERTAAVIPDTDEDRDWAELGTLTESGSAGTAGRVAEGARL